MKKILFVLVVLSSISFMYSSCKEEDNDNDNPSNYSNMRGRYLFSNYWEYQGSWDHINWDNVNTNIHNVNTFIYKVSNESFIINSLYGSGWHEHIMHREGNEFYETRYAGINLQPPYYAKGNIKLIPIGNPVFPHPHYELSGAFFLDTNFIDTARNNDNTPRLFALKQVAFDTTMYQK